MKSIFLKGPLLTRSGYGEQARFALRALRSRPDLFDIYIQPLNWGQTSWLGEMTEERQWIDKTIEKTINHIHSGGRFDISLQVTIPNEWEQIAPIDIGYTAGIETTKVAHDWLLKGNTMDKIIVVSTHSKNVLEDTHYTSKPAKPDHSEPHQAELLKLNTPVTAVNYPVKKYKKLPEIELDLKHDFNFVCVAQLSPRKNVFNTLKWFMEEFKDDEVGLILKTNLAKNCVIDREQTAHQLKSMLAQFEDYKCKVYLLHGDMTDEEMHSLYLHPKIKSIVSLAHGEGFGLPLFEAAYSGLPVVSTGWSGQLDFLVDKKGKSHFYDVSFDLNRVQKEVVWEGVIIQESLWAYPREISAKENMRQCYEDIKNNTGIAADAKKYKKAIERRFSEEKIYASFCDVIYVPSEEETDWATELSALEVV